MTLAASQLRLQGSNLLFNLLFSNGREGSLKLIELLLSEPILFVAIRQRLGVNSSIFQPALAHCESKAEFFKCRACVDGAVARWLLRYWPSKYGHLFASKPRLTFPPAQSAGVNASSSQSSVSVRRSNADFAAGGSKIDKLCHARLFSKEEHSKRAWKKLPESPRTLANKGEHCDNNLTTRTAE